MSVAARTDPPLTDADLPRRTWRRWWRELPKWFRIGFGAIAVPCFLQAAVIVRMAIGWMEEEAVTKFRARGRIQYFWQGRRKEPFPGYNLAISGFYGRSARNVVGVYFLPQSTDEDVAYAVATFPNLRHLELMDAPGVSLEQTRSLCEDRKIEVWKTIICW